MPRMITEGLEALLADMKAVSELPDDVIADMLQAGADEMAGEQRQRYKSQLYDKGTLARSIKISRMKTKRDGTRFVAVYPQGTHHTYTHNGTTKKVSNAEVAFVHEYGAPKRGIAAKGIMRAANEASVDRTVVAEANVYDAWLNKHNL